MKNLKSFEKELSKCSKCGLCQTVCPIYKITQNECSVSKGIFTMLHGVTKGDLELSDRINNYLDMCLRCGKCHDFCPAGIQVSEIFCYAKHEYMQKKILAKLIFFLQSKFIFGNFVNFFSFFGKFLRKKRKKYENGLNVIYFKGCVNKIFPQTGNYLDKILKSRQINIIEPNFDCCGLPFLSDGNIKRFEECAKYNLKHLNTECDYIMTDCASCQSTILEYPEFIQGCNIEREKFLNWGEIISRENIEFIFEKPVNVTFHKPCHLKDDSFFVNIINNCKNVEYTEMNAYAQCCGFAGSFGIKNRELSNELMKNKATNITNTGADYVITTCPSCMIGLKIGLKAAKNKRTKVVSLLEFLAKADKIK